MKGHGKSVLETQQLTPYEQFNLEVPADTFPAQGMSARAAQAIAASEAWTDANPMLNLSSFVTTYMEPEAREIMAGNVHKNFIDHDMYPRSAAMETHMVKWLHHLWHGPKGAEPYGAATIGSSEACMLAGLAHKWNWRERREKAGKDGSRPNMVTGGNVQIVWKKFMRYFDVEPRIVPLKPGKYTIDGDDMAAYVDENTICVVAIAGTTFTGEDDDIRGIAKWLDDYQAKSGNDVPLHVDGASGAFTHPFLWPDYEWDFRLPRVQSINGSGHKYGLVYPGLGWVIFRERKIFNEKLVFYVNYLGGEMPTATLNFSRNGAPISAQYYMFLRLGHDGYTRVMKCAYDNSILLRDLLVKSGRFRLVDSKSLKGLPNPQTIPLVGLRLDPSIKRYNEFDVSGKIRENGWVLSAYTMPPDAQEVAMLRVVVRPHLNRNVIEQLAEQTIKVCDYLDKHGGTATAPTLHDAHKKSEAKC